MEIPLPYLLIIKKIDDNSFNKTMNIVKAKKLISISFRIKHQYARQMLHEMEKLGLIKFKSNTELELVEVSD